MDRRHGHAEIPPFRERLPCEARELRGLRRRLDAWLCSTGAPQAARDDVLLATSEAAANAVQHPGQGRTCTVSADVRGADVVVTVRNGGRWIDGEHPHDDERGRGLLIMRALASRVDVRRAARSTTVTLTFAGLLARQLAAA